MSLEQGHLKDSLSSVEFCKHNKFDYRKDHKIRYNPTGTEGPQG